jgi:hypothetical protein
VLTICPHRLYEALLYRGILIPDLLIQKGFCGLIKEFFIPSFPSPEKQTKRLFDALSHLKHLEMLSIEDDLPHLDSHSGRLNSFRSSLSSFLWRTFGNTLLTLEVKIWDFKAAEALLHSTGIFCRLTHLVIFLQGYNFVAPMAPFFSFVDSLCPMVETLWISIVFIEGVTDLGSSTKDNLELLDSDYSFDWKCLGRLLQNNPKIQELCVGQYGWQDPPMPGLLNDSVSSEKDVGRHLPVLPILHTLSLDFGSAEIKGDVIKYFGALTSNTLTTLSMSQHFLSYQDVKLILKIFNRCDILVDLQLGISCLTSQLVDLLAEHCPSLEKLALYADGYYLGEDQVSCSL